MSGTIGEALKKPLSLLVDCKLGTHRFSARAGRVNSIYYQVTSKAARSQGYCYDCGMGVAVEDDGKCGVRLCAPPEHGMHVQALVSFFLEKAFVCI